MKKRNVLIVASLVVANFLAQLMQTMLNTALPQMMEELGIPANRAQWLITAYLLASGIVMPVTGFLIGKYSTRTLFFVSVGAFTSGTLLAGFSYGFEWILCGRILQGVGTGLLVPLFLNTIIQVFPKEKLGAAMGLASLIVGLAPALGPTISGFVIQEHSWRLLFYVVAPVALGNLAVGYFFLVNVGETRPAILDKPSILYSSIGFGSLLYGFSILGEQGSSALLSGSILLLGCTMILLFVKRQFNMNVPLLDFNVFRYPQFTYATLISVLMFIVMSGVELLLPLYAQNVRGMLPRQSGLLLLPGALLMGVSGVVSGRIYDRFGGRNLLRSGFTWIALVMAAFTAGVSAQASYGVLMLLFALLMTGIGCMMTPLTALAMTSLPRPIANYASPMTTVTRTMSMSMGGALLVTLVTLQADYSAVSYTAGMHKGIYAAFIILAVLAVLGFILSLFIPLREGHLTSRSIKVIIDK
ncbi:DHA2 family efflux MFS transporter permease subunit [Paenibacillus tepidiphilus]|uniref:DHA2 family efflux MFS transporter permease subunit n=1 Tax=Paenibacillus tepidiphilus TaxID=2608683 RepID=UPI00123A0757|nr:DHA2 family efflux MFS transporter permease subunit [Paenibacillus tepidiphilus]